MEPCPDHAAPSKKLVEPWCPRPEHDGLVEPWWKPGGTLVEPYLKPPSLAEPAAGEPLVEPWWNLSSGSARTTPEPIWAETPKLSIPPISRRFRGAKRTFCSIHSCECSSSALVSCEIAIRYSADPDQGISLEDLKNIPGQALGSSLRAMPAI